MSKLPVDFSLATYSTADIEYEIPVFNRWFELGWRLNEGLVDIAGPEGEVLVNVPWFVARRIIAARDLFCDVLLGELNKLRDNNGSW